MRFARIPAAAFPLLFLGFALTAMLLIATHVATAGPWQGEEVMRDGILHVMNPALPMEGAETLEPRELWRLGGESEDEEELFGRVERMLCDVNGEIYFLDSQLNEIRVFSDDGEYLRTVGREGEGPGEFRNGVDFFFLPQNRLGVLQLMPARIVLLDRDGNGLSDLPLPFAGDDAMAFFHQVRSRGENIVLSYMSPGFDEGRVALTNAMVALDGEGNVRATLREKIKEQRPGEPIRIRGDEGEENFFRDWELGADGRVYVAPFYQGYRIFALNPTGATFRVIERDYQSVARTKEEIQEIREQQSGLEERYGIEGPELKIIPYRRDVTRILPRDDGDLWVLTSRGEVDCPEGALGIFDVFDPQGRYVRQVTLKVDFDDIYDDFAIAGDRLFVFKEANAASDQVSSGAGGRMMMIRRGGTEREDDHEPRPFEIVAYELPLGKYARQASSGGIPE